MDWVGWGKGSNQRPNRLPTLFNYNESRVSEFRIAERHRWGKLLMEIYYPFLLTRAKAMLLMGLTRRRLEDLAINGIVRTYTTKGGHKRYFRDDLINFIKDEHN